MSSKTIRRSGGMTLIELMVAMAILAIAAIGALGYQYHTAVHSKIAKLEMTATRTAQLLLEDWKSCGGISNYDPSSLGLGFERIDTSNVYKITVDGLTLFARLSFRDIEYDAVAGVTLREISVIMRWRRDAKDIAPTSNDASLVLTTYVRLDG